MIGAGMAEVLRDLTVLSRLEDSAQPHRQGTRAVRLVKLRGYPARVAISVLWRRLQFGWLEACPPPRQRQTQVGEVRFVRSAKIDQH